MLRTLLALISGLVWCLVLVHADDVKREFCAPSSSCWPTPGDVQTLRLAVQGDVFTPENEEFLPYTDRMMANLRYRENRPAIIIFALNEADVVTGLQFAQRHNMRITILSSGHSFVGRSTADDSVQINLSRMNTVTVDSSDPSSPTGFSAMIQSGTQWVDVYRAADAAGLVSVGGSAHTVSVGGYTLGGGHSPMSRALGLGVDQVLEMTVVTADGLVRRVNSTGQAIHNISSDSVTYSSDTDLFWALRGGGGSTFGIVTSFKYKLHPAPSGFVQVQSLYPFVTTYAGSVGVHVYQFLDDFLKTMKSPGWGGYIISQQVNDPTLAIFGITGTLYYSLLHFGAWDSLVADDVTRLQTFMEELQIAWKFAATNHSTFWSYEEHVNDSVGYHSYVFNTFQQQQHLDGRLGKFLEKYMKQKRILLCTSALLGGKMADYSDNSSSVGSNFRQARTSVSCGGSLIPPLYQAQINAMQDMVQDLEEVGSGMYFNEPDSERDDWKSSVWGDKYERLLQIKSKYDPQHWFTCDHCVGDGDFVAVTTTPTTTAASTDDDESSSESSSEFSSESSLMSSSTEATSTTDSASTPSWHMCFLFGLLLVYVQ